MHNNIYLYQPVSKLVYTKYSTSLHVNWEELMSFFRYIERLQILPDHNAIYIPFIMRFARYSVID